MLVIVFIVWYIKRDIYLSLPALRKLHLPANPRPLVLTLSSTPTRLRTVVPDILYLLANQFARVRINLPAKFRNKDTYDPLDIERLGVEVKWGGHDYGPLMKILPTFYDYQSSPFKAVVSIDDDIFYSPRMAESIMKLGDDAVYSGNIQVTRTMRIPYGADVIVYPIPLITKSFLTTLEYLVQTPCKMHDDMMIAIACKVHGIPVRNCPRMRVSQTREQYSSESLVASTNRELLERSCNAVYEKSLEFKLL